MYEYVVIVVNRSIKMTKKQKATTTTMTVSASRVPPSSSSSWEILLDLIQERNVRETLSFVAIHQRCDDLERQVEMGQKQCEYLQRQLSRDEQATSNPSSSATATTSTTATATAATAGHSTGESAALRNERKMREQLEQLEEALRVKTEEHEQAAVNADRATKDLVELKLVHMAQETSLMHLQDEVDQKDRALEHVTAKVEDSQQRTKLAEQQYVGLKDTIRILQQENDEYQKENRLLEGRLVEEKERLSSEMNSLTDMVERLKREADMLRNLQKDEEKQKSSSGGSSWFGLSSLSKATPEKDSAAVIRDTKVPSASENKGETSGAGPGEKKETKERRHFGSLSVVVPLEVKLAIPAHHGEALCVRYDDSGADLLATGGADGAIRVWNTTNGALQATLKGGGSNAILSCDLGSHLVASGGSDKTCRIYNVKTQRMVHQLVGHGNKITSVRFFDGEKGILSASADRRLKVWDISKQTYRQIKSIRLNSTANAIDVGFDSYTVVTGHVDGGIGLWDIRTGQRTAEIESETE